MQIWKNLYCLFLMISIFQFVFSLIALFVNCFDSTFTFKKKLYDEKILDIVCVLGIRQK